MNILKQYWVCVMKLKLNEALYNSLKAHKIRLNFILKIAKLLYCKNHN